VWTAKSLYQLGLYHQQSGTTPADQALDHFRNAASRCMPYSLSLVLRRCVDPQRETYWKVHTNSGHARAHALVSRLHGETVPRQTTEPVVAHFQHISGDQGGVFRYTKVKEENVEVCAPQSTS
jgi:hypothetical protein